MHTNAFTIKSTDLNKEKRVAKTLKPTEASETLQRSIQFVMKFGIIIGVVYNYDWKTNLRFIITRANTIFFWTQICYSHIYYTYHHNAVRNCEVFAIYGIAISAVLKIDCYEKYHNNITALFRSTDKICRENGDARGQPFINRMAANFTFYKFVASMAVIITPLYMFYPVKSYVLDGEFVQFVPIEIMFVDQSTNWGFLISSAIMGTLGLYAILGTEFMVLSFVVVVMNYAPRVDILEANFNELDSLWSAESSPAAMLYKHTFLLNICRKHADMREYIAEVKRIFDRKLYIFFVFAYFSQILCLFQIKVNNWVPGYALAIGFSMEMVFYCMMGTRLTVENERVCRIITQSHWYTYDIWSQKLLLVLLDSAMNYQELRIGPFAPLSVYTSTEIFKSIYSYYTLMMEVM